MINIGLLGTWHVHFEGYAKHAASDKDCKITAVYDNNEVNGKAAAEKFSCDYENNLDAFLSRKDIDAVIVCTETSAHKEAYIKAARAGKHIFTEKVLCFNEKDALEVKEEIEKAGVKFCISFPWRSRGDFRWIKQAIDEGLIGKVTYCRMRNVHNGAVAGWLPATFYDKESCGGGAMMDLGAHPMYLLNWFMGEPVKASSAFTNVEVKSVEDNAVTVLTYENGAIGVSETGFLSPNYPFELELSGEKGSILSGGFLGKTCYNVGEGWVFPGTLPNLPDPLDMFINALTKGEEIVYGIDDAVALSKTMEMAYSSVI